MNAAIVRLFALVVLLFALLIAWTSRWSVFEATALNNNQLNARPLIDQLMIKRGRIVADDGTVLAKSVPARGRDVGPPVPDRVAVRAGGRLLDRRSGAGRRAGAVARL